MEPSSLIIEHNFDQQTIDELTTLRDIRLGLARKQLSEAQHTIEELVARKLIPAKDWREYLAEFEEELQQKIQRLESMQLKSGSIHFSEIEFYIDLIESV